MIVTKRCPCCGYKVKDVDILFNIECWCGTKMLPYATETEENMWMIIDEV